MSYLRLPLLVVAPLLFTACVYVDYPSAEDELDDAAAADEPLADEPLADEGDVLAADESEADWIVTEEDIDAALGERDDEPGDDEPVLEEDDSWEEQLDEEGDPELYSALASSGGHSADRPLVRKKRFRVLNWNIAGGKENNCATRRIRRAVMRFVREADGQIDFISLNEVCPAQFRAIREALRDEWGKSRTARFSAFVGSGGSRVGNAIFSRRNLRTITRHELGSDKYGKRFLLCGLQKHRRVRVCSAHLTPADSKARVQLARALKRLESWWVNQRDTVIIAGDFNIQPNDPGLNRMYSRDANTRNNPRNHGRYREWDDDDRQHCRGYGERTLPNGGGGPCGDGGKIDFIFARENRIVDGKYGANALAIPTDCTGKCSDHRPIRGFADLRFRVD